MKKSRDGWGRFLALLMKLLRKLKKLITSIWPTITILNSISISTIRGLMFAHFWRALLLKVILNLKQHSYFECCFNFAF